jgi:molybdopterin-guanine dinucleotide biosynthesis protein A
VLTAWEQPPGSGPAAAVTAGLALVPHDVPQVALLAGDLPLLTSAAVRRLRAAVTAEAAVFIDQGRRQFLCAVWRHDALRRRLSALGPPEGVPLKRLYADAEITDVETPDSAGPPPWYDCDTGADIARAEAWLRERRTPTGT